MQLLEEMTNFWNLQLYSLLHLTNFTTLLTNKLHYEGMNNDDHVSNGLSLLMFLTWLVLYYTYKKFLNLMLRRMRYPMVKRTRLIEGLWCCSFSACSALFLTYFLSDTSHCFWQQNVNYHLGFLIHKTFYLHYAAVEVFLHNYWLKGWTFQLFASSLPAPSSQKWPEALVVLLYYKASDMGLLNFCRILITLSRHRNNKRVVRFVFFLRMLNWIYMHILLVPASLIFYTDRHRNLRMQVSLWMWLICEVVSLVRDNELKCIYSQETLERILFPQPSQEAIELVNTLKKHRSCVKNKVDNDDMSQKKKTELWQAISCAMTMKKKLKKLRENKQKLIDKDSQDSDEAVKNIYENS